MPVTDFFAGLEEAAAADGMPTAYVAAEQLPEAGRALRDAGFSVMIDAIPVDLHPREPRFEISYLLLNPGGADGTGQARFRLKVRVPGTDPRLPTLSNVWASVNWAEREAYDLFGILFDGHPDLRRILMPEDWEGFPLRKDYPVQIKMPVKTYEPLQVTQEEFVANLEAAREHGQRD
jgi:NADH-quinone oxidoreductase subunit C